MSLNSELWTFCPQNPASGEKHDLGDFGRRTGLNLRRKDKGQDGLLDSRDSFLPKTVRAQPCFPFSQFFPLFPILQEDVFPLSGR